MVTAIALLFAAGAFAGGVALGLRNRWDRLRILLPVAAAAVAFRAVLGLWPLTAVALLPFDFYPVVETWWAWPFGFFPCGAGVSRLRSLVPRDMGLVAVGLGFVFFGNAAWGESFTGWASLKGVVDKRGVCRQTSFYSCGAAAAAMLLHSHGIPANEREMAERCRTHYMFGTSMSGFVRGLGRSIPRGRSGVAAGRIGFDELAALARPCIAVVKLGTLANHAIVVDGVTADGVLVRDPRGAERELPRAEFERIWLGLAVWLAELPGGGTK